MEILILSSMKVFLSESLTVGLNFKNTAPSKNPTNLVIPSPYNFMGLAKSPRKYCEISISQSWTDLVKRMSQRITPLVQRI